MDQNQNIFFRPTNEGLPNPVSKTVDDLTNESSSARLSVVAQHDSVLGRRDSQDNATAVPYHLTDEYIGADSAPSGDFEPLESAGWKGFEKAAILGSIVFGACVLLFLAAQTSAFLQDLSYLPRPLFVLAAAAVIAIWLALAEAVRRILWPMITLRRSPTISLIALRSQNRPEELRTATAACQRFLEDINSTDHVKLLETCGWPDRKMNDPKQTHSVEAFKGILNGLLTPGDKDMEWLDEVNRNILFPLDNAALSLINRSAFSTGYSTALAPRGLFDGIIVLANSFELTGRLCRLYGSRPNGLAISLIVAHSMLNTLVASGTGDATNSAEHSISAYAEELTSTGFAALLGKVATRSAEGAVNGLLIKRFGDRVAKSIRPIQLAV